MRNVKSGEEALVKASNRVTARSAAVRLAFTVELASQDDLVRLVSAGTKIIEESEPGVDQEPLPIEKPTD